MTTRKIFPTKYTSWCEYDIWSCTSVDMVIVEVVSTALLEFRHNISVMFYSNRDLLLQTVGDISEEVSS